MRFSERHPLKPNATEVDYTAVSVLLPNIILGASLGILINSILPVLFVSIILVLLIVAAAGKSLYKAIQHYKHESKEMAEQSRNTIITDNLDIVDESKYRSVYS